MRRDHKAEGGVGALERRKSRTCSPTKGLTPCENLSSSTSRLTLYRPKIFMARRTVRTLPRAARVKCALFLSLPSTPPPAPRLFNAAPTVGCGQRFSQSPHRTFRPPRPGLQTPLESQEVDNVFAKPTPCTRQPPPSRVANAARISGGANFFSKPPPFIFHPPPPSRRANATRIAGGGHIFRIYSFPAYRLAKIAAGGLFSCKTPTLTPDPTFSACKHPSKRRRRTNFSRRPQRA